MENSVLKQMNSIFACPLTNLNETLTVLTATSELKYSEEHIYKNIVKLFELIPPRDQLSLTLLYSEDTRLILSTGNIPSEAEFYDTLKKWLDECDSSVELSIKIKKTIKDSRLSVYSASKFCSTFFEGSLYALVCKMEYLFTGNDVIYLNLLSDEKATIITQTLALTSEENSAKLATSLSRNKKLKTIHENANVQSQLRNCLIPEDFDIKFYNCNEIYISKFKALRTIFSAGYIANVFTIDKENVSFKIAGYRPNSCKLSFDHQIAGTLNNDQHDVWFDIYNWIYTGASPSDKIEIARNLISLHCQYKDILNIDKNLLNSMCSSYAVYLKNSVSQYIEVKEEVGRRIIQITQELEKALEELTTNIKRSFLAIWTFILSIIITHIQDNQIENLFSPKIKLLTVIVFFGCIFYEHLCWTEFNEAVKRLGEAKRIFEMGYKEFFQEDEFKAITSTHHLKTHINSYKKTAKKYVMKSVVVLLITLISILNMDYLLCLFKLAAEKSF